MADNADAMTSEDVARVILDYLAQNEVALSPTYLHHQLKLYRNATWSSDTTDRRLKDFHEIGWVNYINRGKGLFEISDEGRRKVEDGLTDEELSEAIGAAQDE
jgi:Fe2+ or Zn2+ uptake regulation protein